MVINRIKTSFWFFIALVLTGIIVLVNVNNHLHTSDKIPELPPKITTLSDPTARMDAEWKSKVAEHDRWLQEAKEWQYWGKDIRRELHSMRAGAILFKQYNHKIEAERREAERKERVRIAKEKAEGRKRLREERIAEQKRSREERKAKKHAKISKSKQSN